MLDTNETLAQVREVNTRDPSFGVELGVIPFDRSYWVVPGQLLAGFYPYSSDSVRGADRLEALLNVGVRHIVNLTEAGEGSHAGAPLADYGPTLQEIAARRGEPVSCRRRAIVDLDIPTVTHMRAILDDIDEAIGAGRTVYVHCWGGRGRTGTVVGCWLARHDLATGEGALDMIRYLRRTDAKSDTEAPETAAQKQFVIDWPVAS